MGTGIGLGAGMETGMGAGPDGGVGRGCWGYGAWVLGVWAWVCEWLMFLGAVCGGCVCVGSCVLVGVDVRDFFCVLCYYLMHL